MVDLWVLHGIPAPCYCQTGTDKQEDSSHLHLNCWVNEMNGGGDVNVESSETVGGDADDNDDDDDDDGFLADSRYGKCSLYIQLVFF